VHTGTFTPPANEAAAYRTTPSGTGLLVTGTSTVDYTAGGNPLDGAWVVVITPQWQSSSRTEDAVILEHRGDADNLIRVYWDGANGRWVFMKRAGGEESAVSTSGQAFTAGTPIVLGITYDGTNAGGMKIFVDGVQEGVGGNFDSLETAPATLTLHTGDGTGQPDAVFDLVAGWSRMLSADEMIRIASNPSAVANFNEAFACDGTLDEGDRLSVGSEFQQATFFDVSEGTRTNALDSVNGAIPVLTPGRRKTASDRTQTVIHVKNAAAQMEVRYRRRYL